jgi:hypothetical protein
MNFFLFFILTALTTLFFPGYLLAATPQEESELLETHISGLTRIITDHVDAKVRIARNLRELSLRRITPKEFYERLARIEMPRGKEQRHLLNEVKKDIANYRGQEGLNYFLGRRLSGGGTEVEMELLSWRRGVVNGAINQVIADFRGRNLIDSYKFRVFLALIGSWASERPDQMTFAGDIDFSFLVGDLRLAGEMKQAFDRIILREVGLTAEQFDAVCTAHGMATDEVYLGKHGQGFAEDAVKKGNVVEILLDEGRRGRDIAGKDALEDIVYDAKASRQPLTDIQTVKWPTEPGISLEMIRHFEHDIVKQNIHTDVDSFVKAAKYLERSVVALKNNTGADPDPAFSKLSQFATTLIANKKSPAVEQVKLIRAYFESINQPFPFEVKLGPENVSGQSTVSVEAKETIIKAFWAETTKAMWSNVAKGIEFKMNDLKAKTRGVQNEAQAREVMGELEKIREMMEIEYLVLQHPEVGVKNIPEQFHRQMSELRSDFQSFAKTWGIKVADPRSQQTLRFIEEMLKARQPSSIDLAMGAMLQSTHSINNILDVLDDKLLGELRGERADWESYLKESRSLFWADRADKFLGRTDAQGKLQAHLARAEQMARGIEGRLNRLLLDNFAARGVGRVNRVLGQSIQ